MVVAVGDEGCQRVHVMRVLNDRNFVGLQEREDALGTEARETVRPTSYHSPAECTLALFCATPYLALTTGLERRKRKERMREGSEPSAQHPLTGTVRRSWAVQFLRAMRFLWMGEGQSHLITKFRLYR